MIEAMSRSMERAVAPHSTYTYFQTLNEPAKSIRTNKDDTRCVVGGRYFIKVFNIEDRRFTECYDLVRKRKLDYSVTDIQWSHVDESIIASAAGNGAIILWDLNKENKKVKKFQERYRFVNRLSFHPVDPYLLSCDQDGYMYCFDIRLKDIKTTFNSKKDNIRDIQFHPTNRNIFCAACESGSGGYIQIWDIRKPGGWLYEWIAHKGPVFTLNWHPEERDWLGTGGRETVIKIWDTSKLCTNPTYTIETISSVYKIKWRPGYKYYIASCAPVLDNDINIWDIRRPYVPFASFQEHTDVATGIIWQKDSNVLLSCAKDKRIYHHVIGDAVRPIYDASHVGFGLSSKGTLGHAFPSRDTQPVKSSTTFKSETSTLNLHEVKEQLDEYWIEKLARSYKFYGKPFSELCDHNAAVANEFDKADIVQTWLILKQLYAGCVAITHQNSYHLPLNDSQNPSPMSSASKHLPKNRRLGRIVESPESFLDTTSTSYSSSSEGDENNLITQIGDFRHYHNEMTLGDPELDIVFGDDDYSNPYFSTEIGDDKEDFDRLPSEAFQLRHSILKSEKSEITQTENEDANLKLPMFELPTWNFDHIVKDMLFHYAEQGDLQMCVTVLLTLGDIGHEMIDTEVQKEWFLGYLDILYCLQLFNIATEVINHAPKAFNVDNEGSTTCYMQCDSCKKLISHDQPGWFCKHCKKICQTCSLCHIPVKGLYVWCQGCAHGGHLQHLKEWFERNVYCPTGCGHKCEYS